MKISLYEVRNQSLRELGFQTYKAYLASDEWAKIKEDYSLEGSVCLRCCGPPEVLHHVKYDVRTMAGLHLGFLAPLCHACHKAIEFDEVSGEKETLEKANTKLFAHIYSNLKQRPEVKEWFEEYKACLRGWRGERQREGGARKRALQAKRDKQEAENKPVAEPGSFYIKVGGKRTRKRHGLF